ncbi:MAG TPA: PPC domain-containing protein, partial [Anaerolineae bacterium]|nr:PPC domain-containing protein [Anaerolineae bacterium]
MADEKHDQSSGPWIATALIAALLLCCSSLVGVMLLDELMPSRPFQTLMLGSPTSTATEPAQATPTPTSTPTPALSTPPPAQDPFEPDDTLAQASPMGTEGDRQAHILSPAGDRDYVSLQVEAGVRYTVETGGLGSQCDTVVTLYDQDGTELAQDDDGGNESLASRLSWTAREDGALFAEVRQFDEDAELEDTGYEIWVSESEPLVLEEDEYEPDDTLEQANEILLGSSQAHTIHQPEDRDWVFFGVQAGQTYVVETSGLQGGMDTIIFLHDEEGG